LLAPRILYCGRRQFYWECQAEAVAEDGTSLRTATAAVSLKYNPQLKDSIHWHGWAETYNQLNFTYPQDKCMAIAGITRWVQERSSLTPILGCWRERMIHDLAWNVIRVDYLSSQPPALNNIPSWNWLSSKPGTRIYFHSGGTHIPAHCLKVVEAEANWSNEELTSDLVSTRLIVRGFVFWALVKGREPSPASNMSSDIGLDICEVKLPFGTSLYDLESDCSFDEIEDAASNQTQLSWRFCLLLTGIRLAHLGEEHINFDVIILEKLKFNPESSMKYDCYMRRGSGQVTVRTPSIVQRFEEVFGEVREEAAFPLFEQFLETKPVDIELV
jgi:hypothetical protein